MSKINLLIITMILLGACFVLAQGECGQLFQRFSTNESVCCDDFELREIPDQSVIGGKLYQCYYGADYIREKEQKDFIIYTIFGLLQLSIAFLMGLAMLLMRIRYIELTKKKKGKSISPFFNIQLHLTLLSNLFHNEYKEDKYYSFLVWFVRIGLILVFLRFSLAVITG